MFFDSLLSSKTKEPLKAEILNKFYADLKDLYAYDSISQDRKDYLSKILDEYGYLNYPHIKALEELSPAETLFALEYKWKNNGIFLNNKFLFNNDDVSVLRRSGVDNSDWIKKEGHEIKLINLAALSNGNETQGCAKFIDWLKQLLILPTGNQKFGIFNTTMYLIPFHPRVFGCAYLPSSLGVSDELCSNEIKEKTGYSAEEQVKLFIQLAQLAGHPVIYDVLPQVSRFAKVVLLKPFIARWVDVKELTEKISAKVDLLINQLSSKYSSDDLEVVKRLYKDMLVSGNGDLSENYNNIYNELDALLLPYKKEISFEMSKKQNQAKLVKKVQKVISDIQQISFSKIKSENDITKQTEIINALMAEGLWTVPGGAWCSVGIPVFDRMADCQAYPIFKHFDIEGKDVSELANLDCQTPLYFVNLEDGTFNQKVIDESVKALVSFRDEYNFDGFRFDHVDHIVDDFSQKNGVPISYRVPAKVLALQNKALKKDIPYFATLAEYMLGGNFYSEYHEKMGFDLLWGNDICCQSYKTPEAIVQDNQELANFNVPLYNVSKLSILKTYNNQDGEFAGINRYPAQLGESGALFKWFKYKFLSGGKFAQRPIFYVDGDESFTQTGIEKTIDNEVPMARAKNYYFYSKFDAISRFVKSQDVILNGEAQIIEQDSDGFATWLITKEPLKTAFLIVSNYKSPFENAGSQSYTEAAIDSAVYNKSVYVPGDYSAVAEYVFNGKDFAKVDFASPEDTLTFPSLCAGEFKVFVIKK